LNEDSSTLGPASSFDEPTFGECYKGNNMLKDEECYAVVRGSFNEREELKEKHPDLIFSTPMLNRRPPTGDYETVLVMHCIASTVQKINSAKH
jgi:hypothetical protein